ncbi:MULTISPECIES: hypothetical protein [unclassified Aureimonas]|uniref:hypothetical protein n=1 Tax=unclassified Aureimonas TaxID=2615206 RepID=UPI000701893F|nr:MULTISPECIES: hypothetical protein [unclassified Aureimonas]KQT57359.1 hypothetical protein ASG62_08465 [Aureimonas sp. Leaf427]KQT77037.1 hypothetical protein ASG54_12330 [Aureimonas sp. Leaf460]
MKQARSFPERLETTLIVSLVLGILLIAQRYNLTLYKIGLCVLVVSTLLQIAVGNLRKDASAGHSIGFIAMVLGIVAIVFSVGIVLVPYFSQLGR